MPGIRCEGRREIELRVEIGAKRSDIQNQFLIENSTLCLFGSAIGVVAGAGSAAVIVYLSGWQVLVRPEVVGLAIGFASVIGIFFGWYPSQRASPMRSIYYELG